VTYLAFVNPDGANVTFRDEKSISDGFISREAVSDLLGVDQKDLKNGWYDIDSKEYLGMELPEKYESKL
jgi:hypothetical protein